MAAPAAHGGRNGRGGGPGHHHSHHHEHGHDLQHAHGRAGAEPEEDVSLTASEQAHFDRIASAFHAYYHMNIKRVEKARRDFRRSGADMPDLLPEFEAKMERMQRCLQANQEFLDMAIEPHQLFANEELRPKVIDASAVRPDDADKVRSTLRQCMRDWSAEGAAEREQCYAPLLDALAQRFPDDRGQHRVLVPGAGLGRLMYDIGMLVVGFQAEGNEVSYFMLLVSDLILNRLDRSTGVDLYPFVHQFSNVWSPDDPCRPVHIPDAPAEPLPDGAALSMVAGDFLEIYDGQEGQWSAVVTCFFIDTARNVVDYVKLIRRLLRPGGVWLNLGPLLYHYEEMDGEPSVELSYTELRHVITSLGFNIEDEGRRHCTYAANTRSMYHVIYDCIFFCATLRQ